MDAVSWKCWELIGISQTRKPAGECVITLVIKPFEDMMEITRSALLASESACVRPWPEPLTPVLAPLACRVCQVWFIRPIWMWSDQQSAWIRTWTEEEKKPKRRGYPLTDIWSRVRDQGGGSQRSCGIILHTWLIFTTWLQKETKWNWWADFFMSHIFYPPLSLSLSAGIADLWALTSLTRLVSVQHFQSN